MKGYWSICTSVEDRINFLAELYDSGIRYSAVNTARSVVSYNVTLSNNTSFGAHPIVCRFLKGVFKLKSSLPKYENIWDVKNVLMYLSSLHPPQEVTLKDLTYKTTMLLALLSAQRCQALHLLSVSSMLLKHDSCVFTIHNSQSFEDLSTTKAYVRINIHTLLTGQPFLSYCLRIRICQTGK